MSKYYRQTILVKSTQIVLTKPVNNFVSQFNSICGYITQEIKEIGGGVEKVDIRQCRRQTQFLYQCKTLLKQFYRLRHLFFCLNRRWLKNVNRPSKFNITVLQICSGYAPKPICKMWHFEEENVHFPGVRDSIGSPRYEYCTCFLLSTRYSTQWAGQQTPTSTQIAKTFRSTLIRNRADTKMSDRYLIEIDSKVSFCATTPAKWKSHVDTAISLHIDILVLLQIRNLSIESTSLLWHVSYVCQYQLWIQ